MRAFVLGLLLGLAPALADAPMPEAPLKVIATIPTYAELASLIGGDLVEVVTLCRPGQDLHAVSVTPSFMARTRSADLLLYTGLDAELWLPDLLRGSANVHLLPGNPAAIDLSQGIALKEAPPVIDRSQGDIHIYGNTHIWTDPYVVRAMAARVRDALLAALPDHGPAIQARHAAFHQDLTRALVRWLTDYRHLRGRRVVVYHRSWIYFLERFGLERVGTIEPKPRVAPTASHLDSLIELMNGQDVRVIVREPFQHPEAAEFVAQATDATVLELAAHPGFPEGVDGIIAHVDHNLAALAKAFEEDDG